MKPFVTLIGVLLLLTGCAPKTAKIVPPGDMDSPITVSDGSTHVKHPSFQFKYEGDDDGTNYTTAEVNDGGDYTTAHFQCTSGCSDTTSYTLSAPWKIEFADNDAHGPNKAAKMRQAASGNLMVHFYGNAIQLNGGAGGIDIDEEAYRLYSAKLPLTSVKCDRATAPGTCIMAVTHK